MALVAYDYDTGSENESDNEEEEPSNSKVILNGARKEISTNQVSTLATQETQNNVTESTSTEHSLFSKLPESRMAPSQISEDNDDKLEDFIPTVKSLKEKKKVQISIPSLRDFDDPENDEPLKKRIKPAQKASGLLGILPPVKSAPLSNTTFVPKTVQNKNMPPKSTSSSNASMMPHAVRKKMETKKTPVVPKTKKGSDSETDDEDIPIPDTFDDQMWEKVCGRPSGRPKQPVVMEVDKTEYVEPEQFTIAPEPEKPYEGLDNRAFKELVGKTKKPIGNIKLIDIHEDQIMPDKDTWMVKSLTDPDLAPRSQIDDPVDPTRKRKHHITYLAQQAKANEQELKSAWATSKSNRMMSRSKYGF